MTERPLCSTPALRRGVMKVIRGITPPQAASALDREGFPAAAAPGLVGIVELECGAEPVLDEVDLGAEKVHRRQVDDHLDAIGLDHLVTWADLAGEIDRVGQPRTTGALNSDPDAAAPPPSVAIRWRTRSIAAGVSDNG